MRFFCGLILLCVLPSSLFSQTIKPGDKVTVIKWSAEFKSGSDVVGEAKFGKNYIVEKVNGKLLWIPEERGYLDMLDVVPYAEAINYLTAEISKSPDAFGYIGRATAWEERGELDSAIADFTEAIRLNPNSTFTYKCRGTAWMGKKEYDKSIADYGEAIRLDPKDANAYKIRGILWSLKQEFEKAIADCDEAIRLNPESAVAYFARGNAWEDKREHDKAIADYDEVIRLEPKNADAYCYRGNAWDEKREYDKAIADYNEGIRIDPKSSTAHNCIAWMRATCPDERYRDGEAAVAFGVKACELSDHQDANCIDTLAAAYAEAKEFEKAVAREEQALIVAREKNFSTEDLAKFEARRELYRAGKPYRVEPKN